MWVCGQKESTSAVLETLWYTDMQLFILHALHIWCIVHVQVLHETQLVETFNLRAAIEYQLKNCTSKPHILAIYLLHMSYIFLQLKQHRMHSPTCLHDPRRYVYTYIYIYIVSHLTSIQFSIGAGSCDPTQPGSYEYGERSNKWL